MKMQKRKMRILIFLVLTVIGFGALLIYIFLIRDNREQDQSMLISLEISYEHEGKVKTNFDIVDSAYPRFSGEQNERSYYIDFQDSNNSPVFKVTDQTNDFLERVQNEFYKNGLDELSNYEFYSDEEKSTYSIVTVDLTFDDNQKTISFDLGLLNDFEDKLADEYEKAFPDVQNFYAYLDSSIAALQYENYYADEISLYTYPMNQIDQNVDYVSFPRLMSVKNQEVITIEDSSHEIQKLMQGNSFFLDESGQPFVAYYVPLDL